MRETREAVFAARFEKERREAERAEADRRDRQAWKDHEAFVMWRRNHGWA